MPVVIKGKERKRGEGKGDYNTISTPSSVFAPPSSFSFLILAFISAISFLLFSAASFAFSDCTVGGRGMTLFEGATRPRDDGRDEPTVERDQLLSFINHTKIGICRMHSSNEYLQLFLFHYQIHLYLSVMDFSLLLSQSILVISIRPLLLMMQQCPERS